VDYVPPRVVTVHLVKNVIEKRLCIPSILPKMYQTELEGYVSKLGMSDCEQYKKGCAGGSD
jgi:hypothetical protein